jgi:hypothetical protein
VCTAPATAIHTEGLVRTFGEVSAVDGIDLDIRAALRGRIKKR